MIEHSTENPLPSALNDLDLLQQRANNQRYRYRQAAQALTSIRGSITPLLDSPLQTLSRLPNRYILHTVVALAVPIALALSQLPTRPLMAPTTRTAIIADSPLSLAPVSSFENHVHDGIVVGDPPLPNSEAIPVPLSLTSRSEALAPVIVQAATTGDATVKLRNGPGLEYDEIERMDASTAVQVIGRYGEWLQVRTEPGKPVYWLASELVHMPEGAIHTLFEAQSKDIPPPPPPKVGMVREDGLRLRDGPGTNYVQMTSLDAGKDLSLVEQYQDWFHVATDELDGWVRADFLDIGSGVVHRVPVTENIPDPNPPLVGLFNAPMVNLRGGPGTAYNKVDALGSGAQVNLLARHKDWYKIETGYGRVAWVFADFLDITPMAQRRVPYTNDIPALPVVASRPTGGGGTTRAAPAPANTGGGRAVASNNGGSTATSGGGGGNYTEPAAVAPPPAPPAVMASGDAASFAVQFVGYPYIYGGAGPGGFDCSGLVTYVYSQYGVFLPHNAAAQFSTAYGASVGSMSNLAPGDLVFFAGTAGPGISHVAIYVGGGRIVHALMPGLGVQVSNVYDGYWISHYAGAIRPYR